MRPRRPARQRRALILAGIAALAGGCSSSVTRESPLSTASLGPPRPQTGMARDDYAPRDVQTGSLGDTRGRTWTPPPHQRWSEAPRSTGPMAPARPGDATYPVRYHGARDYQRGYMPAGAPPPRGTIIEVREGDTLYGLSRRHGVPVTELAAANRLENGRIEIGQRLFVPAVNR